MDMKKWICLLALLMLLTGCTTEETTSGTVSEVPPLVFEPYKVSNEKTGEALYLYGEYSTEVTFQTVKTALEKKEYQVALIPPSDEAWAFEGEEMYLCGKENQPASLYILHCDTEEKAKEAYRFSMEYPYSITEHQFAAEPYFFASAVVRLGKTVYWVAYQDSALKDLFTVYEMTAPASVPVYKGGQYVYSRSVTQAEALETATEAGYLLYSREEEVMSDVFSAYCRMVSPDGQGYLFLGTVSTLEEQLPPEGDARQQLYQTLDSAIGSILLDLHHPPTGSVKLVLLSGNTFVMGDCHAVDAFLAEIQ